MLIHTQPSEAPFVTYDKYMELTGIKYTTLRDQVDSGKVIIKKKDKPREKPMINMVAMNEIAAREALEVLG
ncbi:hypothetical protein [Vibrio sp. 10N.261.55.A7]|uniref:hypothetical protein n=1 Tax=Vibrio sp. 10N.261.55.A7 TaxID=1880851 RepID=UPI000C8574CF|nr:hypothetical protein [Vibrio sp. 10N.261.55.A7]PMJ92837.1 hypothetical protein BCU12_06755 [Vibrio sp. 10N.261.55.A7]